MTKWYDRIGNTIEMYIDNQWIKGKIINGYRTHDGLINMETEDGKNYWSGVNGEFVHFRKCDDSLDDLVTNFDRIKHMTYEELAVWLTKITDDIQSDAKTKRDYQWLEWLEKEIEQS